MGCPGDFLCSAPPHRPLPTPRNLPAPWSVGGLGPPEGAAVCLRQLPCGSQAMAQGCWHMSRAVVGAGRAFLEPAWGTGLPYLGRAALRVLCPPAYTARVSRGTEQCQGHVTSLSTCLPACRSVSTFCLCVYLPACLSICLSVALSACLSACLCLLVCLLVFLSLLVCPFVCLPACLSACVSLGLSVFFSLPACLSMYLPMCLPLSLSLPACPSVCLNSSSALMWGECGGGRPHSILCFGLDEDTEGGCQCVEVLRPLISVSCPTTPS